MRAPGKALGVLGAILSIAGLGGCMTRQPAPAAGQAPHARLVPSPLLGRAFDVVPERSVLIVLVYRAGALAALGHNHVVACRCVNGTVYLPRDPLHAGFDLHIAVNQFTVDDPALRAAEHSADFPPDVPQSARQGTPISHCERRACDALLAEDPTTCLRTSCFSFKGKRARSLCLCATASRPTRS